MYLSLQWLQRYVPLPEQLTPTMIADAITLHTAEVEGITNQAERFAHVVIGEVLRLYPHPNADALQLADINIGTPTPVTIVCGDPKVYVGMKAAFAGEGARVRWHGEGEEIIMKRATIRGVESSGMICAGAELGIEAHFPEQDPLSVSDFSAWNCAPGDSVAAVLGYTDIILEIDNKSLTNRPDLFGHYGFARELAAIYKLPLTPFLSQGVDIPKEPALSISIAPDANIRRMSCIRMAGLTVGPSPAWLQKALTDIGLRPINNIVDVTNYVMYDLGQPLHAFDAQKLAGPELHWRHPAEPVTITTLTGESKEATPAMALIYDQTQPVSLGLIMGLANSEVDTTTTEIILEASSADPTLIRTTATALGLRSDASTRAEKNLDPHYTTLALKKAAQLLLELCPESTITSSLTDCFPHPMEEKHITCTHEFLQTRLGFPVTPSYISQTLTALEFSVTEEQGTYHITVPSHRATKDVSIAEDIVEELARIHGYDDIPDTAPLFPISYQPAHPRLQLQRRLQHTLASHHRMREVYNYSFLSEKLLMDSLIGMDNTIRITNPISEEYSYMRTSLLPNLLQNLSLNSKSYDDCALFELGTIYETNEDRIWNTDTDLPYERRHLAMVTMRPADPTLPEQQHPLFHLKAVLNNLLSLSEAPLTMAAYHSTPNKELFHGRWAHPGMTSHLLLRKDPVGILGSLHPWVAKNFHLTDYTVAVAMLDLDALEAHIHPRNTYKPISKFPSSTKDFTVIVPENTPYQQLEQLLTKASPLVRSVTLKDIFRHPERIGTHRKSVTLEVALHNPDRTLGEEELRNTIQELITALRTLGDIPGLS